MRVLIVTPLVPPEAGGPSYYSVHLREELECIGEEVDCIAFREVRQYPSGVRHLLFFAKVLLRARTTDVMIVLDTVSVALPAVLAARALGVPCVVRVGGDFVWERYVERTKKKVLLSEFYDTEQKLSLKERLLIFLQKKIILPRASHIVFNTAWQREIWKKPYALTMEKTSVIENTYTPVKMVHNGGGGFICASRLLSLKNIDTLQEAYAIAEKRCNNMVLDVYTAIPQEKLHKKMRSARALIVPSLSEVNPNLALEALAMGLPVLLTKDCGIKELLREYVIWIDPKDPKDIAEHMCLLMNEKKYNTAKQRAVSFSKHHSYKDIAKEFQDIYRSFI